MAQATLLQLLNVPDEDDTNDVVEEVDFQHLHRPLHHRQVDPRLAAEFQIFTSDLSSDFSPSELLHLNGNRGGRAARTHSAFIDSLDDDFSDAESVFNNFDFLERENQVNFIMNILNHRIELPPSGAQHFSMSREFSVPESSAADQGFDTDFGIVEAYDDIDQTQLELDLGLGFLGESSSPDDGNSGLVAEKFDSGEHFVSGLRVADMGSESDSDLSRNAEIEFNADDGEENSRAEVGDEGDDDSILGLCWDSFQIEDRRDVNEDVEWEEVNEGVDEREVLSMFLDDDDDDVSVMAREDMISVMGSLEWEVLLDVQNLGTNHEIGTEGFNELDFGDSEHDEYNYTTESDMLFAQFTEGEWAMMGQPPAAKDIIKNLPVVVFSEDELKKNDLICAVCKDEIGVDQNTRQLPCNHRYHGDCILPWLRIRNTCPVCRYELPTDDAEYERRKRNRRAASVH